MSDLKNLLDGKEPETEQEKPEAEAPEVEAQEPEPESEEAEGGEPQQEAAPVEEEKPKKPREQKSVPLAAFLEVQRKLEAKLAEAEQKAAEYEAKQKAQPDYSSFFRKPPEDEYDTSGMVQTEAYNTRFGMSLDFAIQTFGQQRVNAAVLAFKQAAESNPGLRHAAEASYNPVREIVQWHEAQQKLSYADRIEADHLKEIAEAGGLEAFKKSLRAQIEAELKATRATPAADDEDDEAPAQKLNLPSNFNKGGKGGNKSVPASTSLKDILA